MAAGGPLGWATTLSRDGWLLFVTYGLRTFAYGFLSVILGPSLATRGFSPVAIGGIFTASLVGGAVMTIVLTAVADGVGRRRVQLAGAVLMALAGVVFAETDQWLPLVAAAVFGTISPSGKDVGPFLAVEQAMLPNTTTDEHRTSVFAWYNLVGSLAGALGALAVGVPVLAGLTPLQSYRALLWAYAGAALILLGLFAGLSAQVEVAPAGDRHRLRGVGVRRSRGVVARLAALFALDAFAGGFVLQGLVAYWFSLRYGVDTSTLGGIFFGTNVLAAVSFLAAAPLAKRIGLLNTMVFTHLPSNVMLVLVPLMPTLPLAVALLLARHLLSQLDVPTRQSYTMAVVDPDERAAAAGVMAVARNTAAALAPGIAGPMLAVPTLGVPFLAAGSLKIVYDILILVLFRGVRPPEEVRPPAPSLGINP